VNNLKWVILALIIFILLILLLIISKLTIIVNYHHFKNDDNLTVQFKIWFGIIRYKISIPVIKIADDSPSIIYKEKTNDKENEKKQETKDFSADDFLSSMHDMKQLLTHVISLHTIVRRFLRKVMIKKIEWHSLVGAGDAALTGTLMGALWSVKGGLIGLLSHYMKLREMPKVAITPDFQKAASQTQFRCMLQFRIGYAMLAGIKLWKYWKGGRPNFQSKQLSFMSKNKSNTV
jgi:hypothetical protein